MNAAPPRYSALDVLRGLAALAVSWFHFTNGNPAFLPEGWLKFTGAYGWMGVEVFFVISGFIIPYALARSGYRLGDYGVFLVKRVVRLDPPYLVALAVIVAVGYASAAVPGFQGAPFRVTWPQLLLHLGYVNVFFGYPWLNPVFWTLAIELQYYLVIGLAFPVIASKRGVWRWGSILAMALAAALLPAQQFLGHWLVLFLMGIVTFHFRRELVGKSAYLLVLAALGALAVWLYGPAVAMVAVGAALVLAFVEIRSTHPLVFLGHISYSLYLLHVPIGGRLVNLSLRFVHGELGKFGVLLGAMGASIGAAWVLHRFVEGPAQRWSSAIGYRRREVEKAA